MRQPPFSLERIVFMGTPGFALPTLQALSSAYGQQIVAVFTRPDAPQGRSMKLTPSPIKTWAEQQAIPVYTPANKLELCSQLHALKPTLVVVVAYGMLFPAELTDQYFCLNIHGSLLPKYRGASPIQASLLNQETETGITLIRMNAQMDQGEILWQSRISIAEDANYGILHDQLAALGAESVCAYLRDPLARLSQPQDEVGATYCRKILKEDTLLLPDQKPAELLAKIKAFAPKPGAYVESNGQKIKILKARLLEGRLQPLEVQPAGKPAMSYRDYRLGHATEIKL